MIERHSSPLRSLSRRVVPCDDRYRSSQGSNRGERKQQPTGATRSRAGVMMKRGTASSIGGRRRRLCLEKGRRQLVSTALLGTRRPPLKKNRDLGHSSGESRDGDARESLHADLVSRRMLSRGSLDREGASLERSRERGFAREAFSAPLSASPGRRDGLYEASPRRKQRSRAAL